MTDMIDPGAGPSRLGVLDADFIMDHRTPAGLQSRRTLTLRRIFMLTLNIVTLAAVMYGIAQVFGGDGLDWLEIAILGCIAVSAPWTILGFWNALVGLIIATRRKQPESIALFDEDLSSTAPLKSRTAVVMAIRNEDPVRAFSRLMAIRQSLDKTGQGGVFDLFVISDTDDAAVAQEEETLFAANRAALAGLGTAKYRRRDDNTGYKAGNVWEFLRDFGQPYRFFVPLDADSTMGGDAIVRMCRIMQAKPRIGILQSLAVGAPADSVFGRIFQFGMRHGMCSFTLGSAWWQGDCGPFWGHNAVVRVAPFKAYCDLPKLSGDAPWGGPILSHDQIEAVLMRRAGYEVRVLPVETESFEDNPVSILDFMTREQRWCNGNMQYVRLLGMRDLPLTSRFQLIQAILMYLSGPAWMLLTALGVLKAVLMPTGFFDTGLAVTMFLIVVAMSLAPKIFGAISVAMQPDGMARYGGKWQFFKGVMVETVFSILMSPAVALRLTIFLGGLLMGRRIGWGGQDRDAHGIPWRTAARELWPQTLFGLTMVIVLAIQVPSALVWSAPVILGLLFAIPFAVVTASPSLGQSLARRKVCATPEERDMPDLLRTLETTVPLRALSA